MPPSLPPLPPTEVLSPLVTRVLGHNPGVRTLQGTNTYLVGGGGTAALIDTGEADNAAYLSKLREVISSRNLTISSIILTHWHPDHVGGCRGVLDLVQGLVTSSGSVTSPPPVYKVPDKMDSPALSITPLQDSQKLQIADDVTLRVLHTPGHTLDSISLYLEQEECLFSGDTILGGSSGVFLNYTSYMSSLARLSALPSLSRIYPGHGIVESRDVITRYISHRSGRERRVLEVVRGRGSVGVPELTEQVYKDDNLSPDLMAMARELVVLMLDKLIADGHVIKLEEDIYRAV